MGASEEFRSYYCDGPGTVKIFAIVFGFTAMSLVAGSFARARSTFGHEPNHDSNSTSSSDSESMRTFESENVFLEVFTLSAIVSILILSIVWLCLFILIKRRVKLRKRIDILLHALGGAMLIGATVTWCLSLSDRIISQTKWNSMSNEERKIKLDQFGTHNVIYFDWPLPALRRQSRTVQGIHVEHTNDRTRFAVVILAAIFTFFDAVLYCILTACAIFSKVSPQPNVITTRNIPGPKQGAVAEPPNESEVKTEGQEASVQDQVSVTKTPSQAPSVAAPEGNKDAVSIKEEQGPPVLGMLDASPSNPGKADSVVKPTK